MQLEMKKKSNLLIVKVKGELDHHSSDSIRRKVDQELMSVSIKHGVFDFSELSFMDSSGIGMLVGRYRIVQQLGGKMWVVCVDERINRILEMAGIYRIIPKATSVDEVMKELFK